MTGMSHGARNGTLEFFVGASTDDFEDMLPRLRVMGNPERIFHVGPRGAGYVVKLIINQLWFAHTVALGEMMALGVKSGVNPGVPTLRSWQPGNAVLQQLGSPAFCLIPTTTIPSQPLRTRALLSHLQTN